MCRWRMPSQVNFVVYSSDTCGPCRVANAIIKAKGHNVEMKKLGVDFTAAELFELTHAKTVPQVFVEGQHIGGLAELKEYLANWTG
mgnify:CR=1 FL=1